MGSRGWATAVRLGVPDEATTLWVAGGDRGRLQCMCTGDARPPYRVNCNDGRASVRRASGARGGTSYYIFYFYINISDFFAVRPGRAFGILFFAAAARAGRHSRLRSIAAPVVHSSMRVSTPARRTGAPPPDLALACRLWTLPPFAYKGAQNYSRLRRSLARSRRRPTRSRAPHRKLVQSGDQRAVRGRILNHTVSAPASCASARRSGPPAPCLNGSVSRARRSAWWAPWAMARATSRGRAAEHRCWPQRTPTRRMPTRRTQPRRC